MSQNPEISIVVPVYNEEECVERLIAKLQSALKPLATSYELILVDDGSTDGTRRLLREFSHSIPELRAILFRRNFGQTPAMAAGFEHARGETIITMDADLQNDPADIPKLLKKMREGFEIVSGWRYNRQDKLISRKIPSMIANRVISLLTGVKLHDYGCSLKAYKAKCIRSIHAYSDMHRFFPAVASITGARTAEVPVNHFARQFGESKYGISRTFKVFADLLTIFMITKFTSNPGRLFAFFAIPFFLVGSACSLFALESSVAGGVSNIWMGAAALCFLGALHFVFMATLGTMVLKNRKYKSERLCEITATIV